MRRMASIFVASIALASSITVGTAGSVGAATSPGQPDCVPDVTSPPTADPVGTGTNSLSGTIGVAGGDTIATLAVYARTTDWMLQYQVETDVQGNYSFAGLEDGNWVVSLDPERFPNRYYCNQRDEMLADAISLTGATHLGDVNLLVGPGSIEGQITSPGLVEPVPVADATVWAYSAETGQVVGSDITDIGGNYLIEGLDEGDHRIQVAKPTMPDYWYGGGSYYEEAAPVLIEPGNLVIDLPISVPASDVSGTIQLNGMALPPTTISIRSTTGPTTANADSGPNGEFSFIHLPADEYRVYADLDTGSVPVNETIVVDGTNSQTGIELTVPTGSIEGIVRRDGIAVDGTMEYVQVFAESVTTQEQYWSDVDQDGNYHVRYLPNDTFVVGFVENGMYPAVWHPGVRDVIDAWPVGISSGEIVPGIDIDIASQAAITGKVVDTVGDGIEAYVSAWSSEWNQVVGVNTEPDGSYRLEVGDGTYRVSAAATGAIDTWWYDGATDYFGASDVIVAGADTEFVDFVRTRSGFFGTISDGTTDLPWIGVSAVSMADAGRRAYGTTDQDGMFRFEFLPAGDYEIRASDPMSGFETPVGVATSDGSTVIDAGAFTLPTGEISGAVTVGGADPASGGYSGQIELVAPDGDSVRWLGLGGGSAYSFTSLPDGVYYVRASLDLVDGPLRWYPDATSRADATAITISGGAAVGDITIDLPAPGVLTGEVLGPDGQRLDGAPVTLYSGPNPSGGTYVTGTTTDVNGRYRFTVGTGTYTVAVQFDGHEFGAPGTTDTSGWQLVSVPAGTEYELPIQVPQPGYIEGRVTVPFGDDSGIEVRINDDGFVSTGRLVATTEPGGTYATGPIYDEIVTLRFVPAFGSGLAQTWYPGVPGAGAATRVAVVPGATLTGYDVGLGEPVSISGQVTGIDGNPTRAVVKAWAAGSDFDGPSGVPSVALVETLDGSYSFDSLPPGEYVVSASPWYDELVPFAMTYSGDVVLWDDATTVMVPSGGSAVIDIRAQIGSRITGRVVDSFGDGVAGATVNASIDPYSSDQRFEWRYTHTDPDGWYTLTGLVPGSDVRLFAGTPGNTPWLVGEYYPDVHVDPWAPTVAVPANGDDLAIDITLDRGITGTVTIVDDNGPVAPTNDWGSPRPIVCLAPDLPPTGVGCNVISLSVSPGDGVFHLGGMRPGTYNIAAGEWFSNVGDDAQFTVTDGQTVECTLATIGSSAMSSCTVVTAPAGATITGTVTDPFGNPQPGVVVNVHDSEQGFLPTGGYTRADGSYTIRDVPPGTYQLRFEDPYRMGQTEPSLVEWWSVTGDVFADDYPLAGDVVVTGTEALPGYDVQLDLPLSGTVTVGDGTTSPPLTVLLLCEGTSSFDGFNGCVDGSGNTVGANYGEISGDTASFEYVLPGVYTAIGLQGSFWTGDLAVATESFTFSAPASSTFACTLPLLGSGDTPGCTITPVAIVEDDDGVDSTEEQGAPNNGDGNADGIDDDQQDSVASLEDPTIPDTTDNGSNYVTIEAAAVDEVDPMVTTPTRITSVAIIQPTSPPPAGVTPQSSVLSFTTPGLTMGQTVSLRVFLPQQADSYWKYDPLADTWLDATSLASFDPTPTLIGDVLRWGVTLTITDGGFGDDDGLADGKVEDPGMFTLTERERPTVSLDGLLPGARVPVGSAIGATCVTTDNVGVATDATLTVEPIGAPHVDGVGAYRATCDGARDLAGNAGLPVSVDFSFVYGRADGVFTGGPVEAPPVVNQGKAGRTFPMRWELYRADGSKVNQLTAVTDWAAYDVPCSTMGGDLVNPVVSTSTEASTLRVTPAGEFQLNLKTAKSDECLVVAVSLTDGSAITARFSLR